MTPLHLLTQPSTRQLSSTAMCAAGPPGVMAAVASGLCLSHTASWSIISLPYPCPTYELPNVYPGPCVASTASPIAGYVMPPCPASLPVCPLSVAVQRLLAHGNRFREDLLSVLRNPEKLPERGLVTATRLDLSITEHASHPWQPQTAQMLSACLSLRPVRADSRGELCAKFR
jgi:hypothetical protein